MSTPTSTILHVQNRDHRVSVRASEIRAIIRLPWAKSNVSDETFQPRTRIEYGREEGVTIVISEEEHWSPPGSGRPPRSEDPAMPAIDVKLMTLRASLEHQLEEAKAGAAEARAELAIFNLPKAEQVSK